MNAAGVRGVRLNLETNTAGQFDPSSAKALLDATAEQTRGLGWHIQMYTRLSVVAALKEHLAKLPFPVVFDHFGRANPALGANQAGFDALLDLVKSCDAYVKISGAYRVSQKEPDYADVTPLAQALVQANPDRIVWGTDWPHPNSDHGRGKPLTEISPPFAIDDGLLLNQLAKWAPDAATRKKILVDNPARLYGFEVRAICASRPFPRGSAHRSCRRTACTSRRRRRRRSATPQARLLLPPATARRHRGTRRPPQACRPPRPRKRAYAAPPCPPATGCRWRRRSRR